MFVWILLYIVPVIIGCFVVTPIREIKNKAWEMEREDREGTTRVYGIICSLFWPLAALYYANKYLQVFLGTLLSALLVKMFSTIYMKVLKFWELKL